MINFLAQGCPMKYMEFTYTKNNIHLLLEIQCNCVSCILSGNPILSLSHGLPCIHFLP